MTIRITNRYRVFLVIVDLFLLANLIDIAPKSMTTEEEIEQGEEEEIMDSEENEDNLSDLVIFHILACLLNVLRCRGTIYENLLDIIPKRKTIVPLLAVSFFFNII